MLQLARGVFTELLVCIEIRKRPNRGHAGDIPIGAASYLSDLSIQEIVTNLR